MNQDDDKKAAEILEKAILKQSENGRYTLHLPDGERTKLGQLMGKELAIDALTARYRELEKARNAQLSSERGEVTKGAEPPVQGPVLAQSQIESKRVPCLSLRDSGSEPKYKGDGGVGGLEEGKVKNVGEEKVEKAIPRQEVEEAGGVKEATKETPLLKDPTQGKVAKVNTADDSEIASFKDVEKEKKIPRADKPVKKLDNQFRIRLDDDLAENFNAYTARERTKMVESILRLHFGGYRLKELVPVLAELRRLGDLIETRGDADEPTMRDILRIVRGTNK